MKINRKQCWFRFRLFLSISFCGEFCFKSILPFRPVPVGFDSESEQSSRALLEMSWSTPRRTPSAVQRVSFFEIMKFWNNELVDLWIFCFFVFVLSIWCCWELFEMARPSSKIKTASLEKWFSYLGTSGIVGELIPRLPETDLLAFRPLSGSRNKLQLSVKTQKLDAFYACTPLPLKRPEDEQNPLRPWPLTTLAWANLPSQ